MNIRKLFIVAAAIAINVLVLAWFHAWTAATVASAAPPVRTNAVVTLPTVYVHPSAAQVRELRRERAVRFPRQADAGDGAACIAMPSYSFAAPCPTVVAG